MKKLVLLILSLYSLYLYGQETYIPINDNLKFKQILTLSSEIQSNNKGFIRMSQYGNNNKTNISTQGHNIDIDAIQYGYHNTIDFDIYGKNTYNNIYQSGQYNTAKGEYSLYYKNFNLIQQGKNNYLEIRKSKIMPMIIQQRGKGIRMIIY